MMFVAFNTTIILAAYTHFEQPVLHASSTRTIATMFAEYTKYQIRRSDNGEWEPAYAMNKDQKEGYKQLDLTEEEIQKEISPVSIKQ